MVTYIVGVGGAIFGVFSYFRNPQIKTEKQEALLSQEVINTKAELLKLSTSFNAHILADQSSFSTLNQHVIEVDKSVVRLTTIIDERIPKK